MMRVLIGVPRGSFCTIDDDIPILASVIAESMSTVDVTPTAAPATSC